MIFGILQRIASLLQEQQQCREDLVAALSRQIMMHNEGGAYTAAACIGVGDDELPSSPITPATALAAVANNMDISTVRNDNDKDNNSSSVPVSFPISPDTARKGVRRGYSSPRTIIKKLQYLHETAVYLTATLAYLPYESSIDPLLIIQWITRQISVTSSILVSEVSKCLLLMGARHTTYKQNNRDDITNAATATAFTDSSAAIATYTTNTPVDIGNTSNVGSNRQQPRMSTISVLTSLEQAQEGHLSLDFGQCEEWYQQHCGLWSSKTLASSCITSNVSATRVPSSAATSNAYTIATQLALILTGGLEARSREALSRLKVFLKQTYNLSRERCQQAIASGSNGGSSGKSGEGAENEAESSGKSIQVFTSISSTAAHISIDLSVLAECITDNIQQLSLDRIFPIIRATVADCNRLKSLCDADEDLGISNTCQSNGNINNGSFGNVKMGSHRGESKKRKATTSNNKALKVGKKKAIEKSAATRRSRFKAKSTDMEEEEDEDDDKDDDLDEDDEIQMEVIIPRRSSSGRVIKHVERL